MPRGFAFWVSLGLRHYFMGVMWLISIARDLVWML